MEWRDEAIILDVKPYSDHQLRIMLMTAHHGRHAGMARASRRRSGTWLPGARVHAQWRARLPEHLGMLTMEPITHETALITRQHGPFSALLAACALVATCVPEREPNPAIYDDLSRLIAALPTEEWRVFYALFELSLLQHLGFRLELSRCAVSGETNDLVYISPRSGKAVSRAAGEPYRDRLFRMPSVFSGQQTTMSEADWTEALKITAHFLTQWVLSPLALQLPQIRQRLH